MLNENKLERWGLPGGSALAIAYLINQFTGKDKELLTLLIAHTLQKLMLPTSCRTLQQTGVPTMLNI